MVSTSALRTVTALQISGLAWTGCWTVANGTQAAIGRTGLVAPLDSFNAGYRYRNNWRPRNVG